MGWVKKSTAGCDVKKESDSSHHCNKHSRATVSCDAYLYFHGFEPAVGYQAKCYEQ